MTDLPSALACLLLIPALLSGFFLPGYLVTRHLPGPDRICTSVLGSLILLYAGLVFCDLVSIPVSLGSLSVFLGTASAAGWFLTGRRETALAAPATSLRLHPFTWATLLIVASGLGMVVLRAVIEPLAGWDNGFRWNHLALMVHATGRLDFYPPVSAGDFFLYPWCDGIPPLVAAGNLWIYLFTGSTHGALAGGRILVEVVLVAALVWRISCRLWGEAGARISLLILVCSPLFLFSVSLGQETGLTAVLLLMTAFFLLEHRNTPTAGTAVWIGLAAGTAALVRDYNLIFVPASVALLAIQRPPPRHVVACLLAGGTLGATWYARNAVKTGNFIFPHDLGGLLPTNAFHIDTMSAIKSAVAMPPETLIVLTLPLLIAGAGLAFVLAPWGAWKAGRAALPLMALTAALFGLWWVSVPSTAGGLVYSTRVLGAAIPFLCILSGWVGTRLRSRFAWPAILGLTALLAADSARRSWIFLQHPTLSAYPWDWDAWQSAQRQDSGRQTDALWRFLIKESRGSIILCDHPASATAYALEPGARVTTLFSPLALPITDTQKPRHFSAVIRDLIGNDVRFVVLAEDLWTNLPALRDSSQLRLFYQTPPMIHFQNLRIYDLHLLRTALSLHGAYPPPAD